MELSVRHPDIGLHLDGHVVAVELRRPPHNYFDQSLIAALADIFEALDRDEQCRAIVLASEGTAFCAGADHSKPVATDPADTKPRSPGVFREAVRLFRTKKPVIAAVQGAAVGGGLGLALVADFRVTCPQARFWANFSRLGFHAGFGLTATLPRLIGQQRAALLLYTGRRVNGDEAVAMGLADILVPKEEVRATALTLAKEISEAAPLAVLSMRQTLRRGFADEVEAATEREHVEQTWQRQTNDFREGVRAIAERRPAVFLGR